MTLVRARAPLNEPDQATFYGGDHRGYTDYPTLAQIAVTPDDQVPDQVPSQAASA